MKTISFINFKGGCGKTTSAINVAYILAVVYNLRVLIIDNDDQGNTSRFFNVYKDSGLTLSDVLIKTVERLDDVIVKTSYSNIDIIPANTSLAENDEKIDDLETLKSSLATVADRYDYCIIDNAPSKNNAVAVALVATDDVLIPIKLDRYILDGLAVLEKLINQVKNVNKNIAVKGCFITEMQKNKLNAQGRQLLERETLYPVFKTTIRQTVRVRETTFNHKPLLLYAKRATATQDYLQLVAEYLKG